MSSDVEGIFDNVLGTNVARVDSLAEVRGILDSYEATTPGSLDLLAHSTRGHKLLRLGHTVIDAFDREVSTFFRDLSTSNVLVDKKVVCVRLLGCETATTFAAQRTLVELSRILGLEVYGTTKPTMRSHYDSFGFRPVFGQILIGASNFSNRL